MYVHEGLFSYWKGILPPILAETPKRATKFVCFEQYKQLFMFGSEKATPLVSYQLMENPLISELFPFSAKIAFFHRFLFTYLWPNFEFGKIFCCAFLVSRHIL